MGGLTNTARYRTAVGCSLLALPLLWGCVTTAEHSGDQNTPRTFVYKCSDNYTFVTRIGDDHAWLFLPGQTVKLPQVPSGSGTKYSDGPISFRSKGDEALLETTRTTHRNCVNNRSLAIWEHAKLNGVDFRGVGNEPGWYLEIRNGESIQFVTNYGDDRYLFDNPKLRSDSTTRETVYRAVSPGHRLEVLLKGETCQDSMADESYETRVRVDLDGRVYRGCGKALN